jgi:hypothetical protein
VCGIEEREGWSKRISNEVGAELLCAQSKEKKKTKSDIIRSHQSGSFKITVVLGTESMQYRKQYLPYRLVVNRSKPKN